MAGKIRVLVADDSASVRSALMKGLSADPGIEVVGFACDGIEALEQVKALRPNVLTLDVEMPRMDGLRALEQIMKERPTAVVMVSSLTGKGTEATIKALELGAVDFALKTAPRGLAAVRGLIEELRKKIRVAAMVNVAALARQATQRERAAVKRPPAEGHSRRRKRVVVIASSTGGPRALRNVIPLLPADLAVPVLVVQHLPAGFTARLAESLNGASALTVEEARPGVELSAGRVLVAPGGVHMRVAANDSIRLNLDERECGVRPSANLTMESAASVYGDAVLGVVLTGMGSDGTRGAALIKGAGGEVIVEHESTCVVYGMPKSVVDEGYADRIAPLSRIASEIVRVCGAPVGRTEARV